MIWMLLTWRYDHRSCNNNLSNCKLTPKTNENMMWIWSFFASPSYPSVLDISTILHRWWSTSRFEELRLGTPSIYSLQKKIITYFCLWSVNFSPHQLHTVPCSIIWTSSAAIFPIMWTLSSVPLAVMPTPPAFGGRLTLFCLVSRSPALVHKSPAFYVHYKYWILSKK